jgi:acyl transferase domain-containing protein
MQETLESAGRSNAAVVGTLRRDQGGLDRFRESAAEAYVRGVPLDWTAAYSGRPGQRVLLPTYRFQHRRFWLDPTPAPSLPRGDARRAGDGDGEAYDLDEATTASPAGQASPLIAGLSALSEAERAQRLLDLVRTETAIVLGHDDKAAIAAERAFRELGMESLTAVDLRNRLGAATGLQLPTTLVFDYPSPAAIAGFLGAELSTGTEAVRFPSAAASLDYHEAALAGSAETPESDAEFAALRARLRVLADRWVPAPAAPRDPAADLDLDSATDEELFALMDNDLDPI